MTTGTQPSWLPGGNGLIVTDKYVFPVGEPADQLYRVNLDGSGRTLLTTPESCGKQLPKVSPEGDRVAFLWGCVYLDKVTGVYAIPISGGEPQRLTPNTTHYEAYGGFDWSPDGKRIVYSREPNGPIETANLELFVLDLSGGTATKVTSTRSGEEGPVFSPDGSRIAYHRDVNVWVMNADGSGQTQVTTNPWSEVWPSWQPCIPGVTARCVLTPPPTPPPPAPPPPGPPTPSLPPPPSTQPRTPAVPARRVQQCVVPRLKGRTVPQARRLLASRRCALGKVKRVFSPKTKRGKVIAQNRAAGARLRRGALVDVVVGRGRRR